MVTLIANFWFLLLAVAGVRSWQAAVDRAQSWRWEILISPKNLASKVCVDGLGIPADLPSPLSISCGNEFWWRNRGTWRPVCETPLSDWVFGPRYYRIFIVCQVNLGKPWTFSRARMTMFH